MNEVIDHLVKVGVNMRAILIAVMLLLVVLVIYSNITDGEAGMKQQLKRSGTSMSEHISGISP